MNPKAITNVILVTTTNMNVNININMNIDMNINMNMNVNISALCLGASVQRLPVCEAARVRQHPLPLRPQHGAPRHQRLRHLLDPPQITRTPRLRPPLRLRYHTPSLLIIPPYAFPGSHSNEVCDSSGEGAPESDSFPPVGSHRDFALPYWQSVEGMDDLMTRGYPLESHPHLRLGDV